MTLIKQIVTKNIWSALVIWSALSIFGISQSVVGQTNTFPSTGNVGIGTTSPGKVLTVNGDAGVTTLYGNSTSQNANDSLKLGPGSNGNFFIDNPGAGGYAQTIIGFNTPKQTGGNGVFSIFNNSTDRSVLFFAQSAGTGSGSNQVAFPTGNVGIGTTSPSDPLHVSSASGVNIRSTDSTYNVSSYLSQIGQWSVWQTNRNPITGAKPDSSRTVAGIYFSAASADSSIHFQTSTTNGADPTERMVIDKNGNVGIGTTNPDAFGFGSVAKYLTFQATDTNQSSIVYSLGNGIGAGSVQMGNASIRRAIIAGEDGSNMTFYTNPTNSGFGITERMRINSAGNVGIGTTSPGYKLDVAGAINAAGLNINGSPVTGSQWATSGTTINYGAGNVGIGTTTPGYKLDVNGMVNATGVNVNGSPITSSQWATSGTTINYIAGNVGIGTTTPGCKLDVNGTVNTTGLNVNGSPVTSSQWTSSGSNINYATSGGNVGVGQSNPTYKLDVNGTAHVSGNLTVDGNLAAKYQDVAEWVPASEQLAAGTVVVLDATKSNQVTSSTVSYDTRVAGVVSEQPGIALGERSANKVLVATTGRVRVKVDATRAPIQVGDLLVTSDTPGVAMKSEPVNIAGVQLHRPGTLIGKALEPLAKGSAEILVLLSLQ